MAQTLARRYPRRQALRRAVLLLAFLSFPVTMNLMSPYVIIDGAFQGIVTGSAIVFVLLFVSALFVGRLWCAYLCPAGGIAEACFMVNDRPAKRGWRDWIKWGIWIPWVGLIAFGAISAGGYQRIDVLHLTESGISVDEPIKYITYYMVVLTIFGVSVAFGRRAFCHYGCWMAPFMILGRKVRNAVNTPALRLQATPDQCIACHRCEKACPMSLGVEEMVASGSMENDACILCGTCIDVCPKQVLRYSFSRTE